MSRPLRVEYQGAYYHVMNRGLSRTRIFLDDQDRQRFLDLLAEIGRLWKVRTHAYCLMGNHYHLLVETPQGNLSRVMRHLDGLYTQSFNRRHGRDGPLFRGRYRAILIEVEQYFFSVVRYIHQNPTEAGLVTRIEDYFWSSHRGYLAERHCPKWMDRQAMLLRFGKGTNSVHTYKAFMEDGVETEIEEFYKRKKTSPILGGKEFVDRLKQLLGERAQPKDEIPQSRSVFAPALEAIVSATATAYGKETEELRKPRRGVVNEARGMAIYLCRALGGHKLSQIADGLGLKNYSSTSSAYLSFKGRIEKDRRLARMAREVEGLLNSQKQI